MPICGWYAGYATAILVFFVAIEHTLALAVPASVLIGSAFAELRAGLASRRRRAIAVATSAIAFVISVTNREQWSHAATYAQMAEFYELAGEHRLAEKARTLASPLTAPARLGPE
jgi:hypothetical protein